MFIDLREKLTIHEAIRTAKQRGYNIWNEVPTQEESDLIFKESHSSLLM